LTTHRAFDWMVLVLLVVVWGSAFAVMKIAVEHISPLWNTAARLWIAVATLGVVRAASRQPLPSLSDRAWLFYAANGLVGMAVPFALFATAATTLPSAVNAICNGASPIFTAGLAHLLLADGKLTRRKAAGVALGFVGLLALVAPRMSHGLNIETLALAAALGGAALYAVSNIITKSSPPVPSSVGAFMFCAWGAVFATLNAAVLGPAPTWPPMSSLLAVTALGVFPTGLATVGYVFLIQRRGPLFTSMSIYLAPIWATAIGVLLMHERPSWTAFAALALILSGVALTTMPARARAAQP
jgi:drug/metabolite transporter (DMT)-like permease